jgi:hypothetical protein
MKEFPLRCSHCGRVTMVDLEAMEILPIDQVTRVEGFHCNHCEKWEPVYYSTVSLEEVIAKLQRSAIGSKRYQTLFSKALSKAENLRSRIERRDGTRKHPDLASS